MIALLSRLFARRRPRVGSLPPRSALPVLCRRCGVPMVPGVAIPPAWACGDEGMCYEAGYLGVAPLVAVLKCPECGHSITSGKERTQP